MSLLSVLEGVSLPGLRSNDQVLAQLFEAIARSKPGNVCMRCKAGATWSYSQVDTTTNTMALNLYAPSQNRLVVGSAIVALWQPRGIPLLLSQLAVSKSGAAWLPFDFEAPVSRISVCMNDAKVCVIITSADGKAALEKYAASKEQPLLPSDLVITTPEDLQQPPPAIFREYTTPSSRGLKADHNAYLIYTSGSTGTPKGITITQQNAVHYLLSINSIYGTHEGDVMLQTASVAFDLSVEEIWLLWTVGGSLYVASYEEVLDAESLPSLLQREGITVIDTVPTLLAMISSSSGGSSSSSNPFPHLRIIILGGEALPKTVLEQWTSPNRSIYNTYGPTETTIVATTWLADPSQDINIGQPIPNYVTYVVDPETLQLLPQGMQGELLIGGVGVARGYYQRPELTAAKFIANPFAAAGSREASLYPVLYRSGDACVMTESSAATAKSPQLLFHGRIDDQVKVRGFRVELGEIETHIDNASAAFGIKTGQVAVVLKPATESSAETLIAFVVRDGTASGSGSKGVESVPKALQKAELKKALRALMPAYMIPSVFIEMDILPRLAASGKIDRNALKAQAKLLSDADILASEGGATGSGRANNTHSGGGSSGGASADTSRFSPTERRLAAAACKVFKVATVSTSDDFFNDLGGHSLVVSQFISTLRQTYPSTALASVSFLDLYSTRCIAKLAELVDGRSDGSGAGAGSGTVSGTGAGTGTKVPISKDGHGEGTTPAVSEFTGHPTTGRYTPVPWQRRFLCGLAQLATLPILLALISCKWVGLFLAANLSIRLQCPHKVRFIIYAHTHHLLNLLLYYFYIFSILYSPTYTRSTYLTSTTHPLFSPL